MNGCSSRGRQTTLSFSYAMVEEVVKDMAYIPDAIICEDDDVAKNVSLALLQRDSKAVKRW